MQDEIKVSEGYQPAHQFISFVEGSATSAPDPSSYPLQVLEADHNLNHLDGGDPTDGFAPWVTDILVYPSSEYWEGLLESGRVRPYVDISISNYNTLRIPSAIHNYDLYVDNATIYENLTIEGTTNFSGEIQVSGNLTIDSLESENFSITSDGNITAQNVSGVGNMRAPIEEVSASSYTVGSGKSGYIFKVTPSGFSTDFILPDAADEGTIYTIMLCGEGKSINIQNLTFARGTQMNEVFTSASVFFSGGSWFGFGDLV